MRTSRILFLFIISIFSLSQRSEAQKFEFIKVPELVNILNNPENKLFVVNFWATWCPPCVREFPYFQKLAREYSPDKVRFIMVSLDSRDDLEQKLIPFLEKNNVAADVALMTDLDYNSWIHKVDPDWQGEIPSTLIFNNSKHIKLFHPGEIDEPGLRTLINHLL